MTSHIRGYLNDLARQLHLDPREERGILSELESHISDRAQELVETGVAPDVALHAAINDFGASDDIAVRLYEVHSRGTWNHTTLAALPHLLLSLLFAFHLWVNPTWVAILVAASVGMTVLGWRKGRPRWTFPWLGYCLVVPILSWGLAMTVVGYGAWSVVARSVLPFSIPIYIASLIYVGVSLWFVIKNVSKVVRPDWIMASLAILPLPFLGYWFFYFYNRGEVLQSDSRILQEIDSAAAIVFLILGAATAVFFRVGRRMIRVVLLIITAPSLIVLAWVSYQGGAGYFALFFFSAISLAILLTPALLDFQESKSPAQSISGELPTKDLSG